MGSKRLFRNIYYTVIIGMLLFCACYIIFSLFVDDQLRFFAFTIDTIYLHWNISFPAVTICETFNAGKTWEVSEKYYGANRNRKLDSFFSDVAFFNGKCSSCNLCDKEIDCPSNVTKISSQFRSSCDEILSNCSWNNEQIECCDAFLPLDSEYGICYTINSIHTEPMYGHRLISNRLTGPGVLSFISHEDIQVHVHASNEVPYDIESDIKEDIFFGSDKEIILKVTDMVNDVSVQDVPISNRKCRFPWERDKDTFPMLYNQYSHSTCAIECSMNIQLELCNCTQHLMLKFGNDANTCDVDGLICLTNNFGKINSLKKDCRCLASCEEPEIHALYSSSMENYRNDPDEPGSSITISMLDLPKERLIRRVVRTFLDDVISIASVVSLLFGLSIISTLGYILQTAKFLIAMVSLLISTNGPRKHLLIISLKGKK